MAVNLLLFGPSYNNFLRNCGTWCNYDVVCTNTRPGALVFFSNWDCEIVNYASIKNASVSYCVTTGNVPKYINRVAMYDPSGPSEYFLDFKEENARYVSGATSTWIWIYVGILGTLGSIVIVVAFLPFIVEKTKKNND